MSFISGVQMDSSKEKGWKAGVQMDSSKEKGWKECDKSITFILLVDLSFPFYDKE